MVFERSLSTFVPAVDDEEPDSLEVDLPAAEDVGTGATGCLTPTAEEVTTDNNICRMQPLCC